MADLMPLVLVLSRVVPEALKSILDPYLSTECMHWRGIQCSAGSGSSDASLRLMVRLRDITAMAEPIDILDTRDGPDDEPLALLHCVLVLFGCLVGAFNGSRPNCDPYHILLVAGGPCATILAFIMKALADEFLLASKISLLISTGEGDELEGIAQWSAMCANLGTTHKAILFCPLLQPRGVADLLAFTSSLEGCSLALRHSLAQTGDSYSNELEQHFTAFLQHYASATPDVVFSVHNSIAGEGVPLERPVSAHCRLGFYCRNVRAAKGRVMLCMECRLARFLRSLAANGLQPPSSTSAYSAEPLVLEIRDGLFCNEQEAQDTDRMQNSYWQSVGAAGEREAADSALLL